MGHFADNSVFLKDIFRYKVEEVGQDGKVKGKFVCLAKPKFFSLFKKKGVEIDESIFNVDSDIADSDFQVK